MSVSARNRPLTPGAASNNDQETSAAGSSKPEQKSSGIIASVNGSFARENARQKEVESERRSKAIDTATNKFLEERESRGLGGVWPTEDEIDAFTEDYWRKH